MSTSKDLSGGAGSPSAPSENLKFVAQKSTATSRARVRKHAAPTRFPISTSSTPKRTATGGKLIQSAKGSVSTLNKAKQLAVVGSSTRRLGQGDRVLDGKAASTTRSIMSGRTSSPIAPRKPAYLRSDAEKWKTQYEELLKEAQKTQSEQDNSKRNLEKNVAEITKTLTDSENSREQAKIHAAILAEEVLATRLDLELFRQENCDLKLEKERLSTQVNDASVVIKDLQTRANLAGELQTELNSLRNVRLPLLEQENKALKQELRHMLQIVETPPDTLKCVPSRVQTTPMDACHCEAHGNTEALSNFLRESQMYIKQLEYNFQWIGDMYADAVFEVDGLENHVAVLQTTADHLKEKYNDLIYGNVQRTEDAQNLQEEKRVLRVVNSSTGTDSSAYTASTASVTSVHATLAGVVAAVQTEPSLPCKPESKFSETPRIEAEPHLMPRFSAMNMANTATHSIDSAPISKPQAPLDRDLQVTINIEPTDQSKLSLLERLTAITTKGTSFKIHGPAEIAKALAHGMEDAQARARNNEAKVLELQQMMWANVSEMERMKKKACSMIEHKTLVDQLAAMEARLHMQDMLLADNGRQLAQLRKDAS
ncbi:hypothetical protein P171DRAFT_515631 [Karstenula rhodostoma CBS 690.94]|uniref:Uncharacterized protein n=1 Tax=Karstenula rhodostoma CBS 690.94 TaxID=1392251 RepID=A0A9P4PYI1_9PLEO|nr:hypothetical protein P171DRAFT_515631 [Karstenula rhodostoma CBS 690.94]